MKHLKLASPSWPPQASCDTALLALFLPLPLGATQPTSSSFMAQNLSMAPSADEAYVHEHCKVLPVLPIVLDTPGMVEEIEQAEHLFARFADVKNPRLTLHSAD